MPQIGYEVDGPVAVVTIDHHQRRNALTQDMFNALAGAVRAADDDREVRCIVLQGGGDAFCAGLDLVEAGSRADLLDHLAFTFDPQRSPAVVLQQIDTPVVAAVNGPAAGYGVGLALNADIRVMAEDARLVSPTLRGLVPESGDTYLLPRLVGWEQAARFYFLGEQIDAERALSVGIVSEVAGDSEATKARAAEVAATVAAMPPLAVQSAKRMMRAGRNDEYTEHVGRVLLQLLPMFRTRDFSEAVAAFMEGRPPTFTGE